MTYPFFRNFKFPIMSQTNFWKTHPYLVSDLDQFSINRSGSRPDNWNFVKMDEFSKNWPEENWNFRKIFGWFFRICQWGFKLGDVLFRKCSIFWKCVLSKIKSVLEIGLKKKENNIDYISLSWLRGLHIILLRFQL